MANTVSILVRADGSSAVRELRRVEHSLTGLDRTGTLAGSRLGRALGTVVRAGAYAAAGGVVALGYGMVKAIGQAADFEQQLNVLKAVSGATGAEMKRISALSIQLGKDVKLPATSAQDAALAMTELAKGGLSVRDSMKAARGALQLAAAGEVDVATAASVTATALNQFHLAGSQATKVADLLAGAANASAGNVTDFAEGLQFAGTAAHAAGQSVTLTVAALAEMANAGLSGSVAGSSLSQALRALQAPTAKAQDAMKKFNLSVYDAKGNMKPLDEIAQTFSTHLGGLTQKQQNATLAQIFGTRAVQAARIVFLGGKDALDKYVTTLGKSGNAARLAEARMKGFRGAIQTFQSAIETLGIQLGLILIPAATTAARALTGVVDAISQITSAKSPSIAVKIAFRTAGKVWDSIDKALFGEFKKLDRGELHRGPGRPIALPFEPRTEGLVQRFQKAVQSVKWGDVGRTIAKGIADGLKFTSEQAGRIVTQISDAIVANKGAIANASAVVALEFVSTLLDPGFWKDNWKTALAVAIAVIPAGRVLGIGGRLGSFLGRGMFAAFARFVGRLPSVIQDAVLAIDVLFRSGFTRIGRFILATLRGTATRFPNLFQRAFRAVERVAVSLMAAAFSRIRGLASRTFGSVEKEGVQAFRGVGGAIVHAAGRLGVFLVKVGVIRAAINGIVGVWNAVVGAIEAVIQKVRDLASAIASLPSLPSIPGSSLIGKIGGILPATGGLVTGGIQGRDSVPALLTPGEIVLNKKQQLALLHGGVGGGVTIINPTFIGAPTRQAAKAWGDLIEAEVAKRWGRRG